MGKSHPNTEKASPIYRRKVNQNSLICKEFLQCGVATNARALLNFLSLLVPPAEPTTWMAVLKSVSTLVVAERMTPEAMYAGDEILKGLFVWV